MNSIQEVRELTKSEVLGQLSIYGECAIVRGTGFGKTWLLADIATEYKNVCFLYPNDIVDKTFTKVYKAIKGDSADDITSITYQKLARMTNKEIKNTFKNFDLIIADECHKLGGKETKQRYQCIKDNIKAHRLLATATPVRTFDDFDVIAEFADGHEVFPYTLADMISDGFVNKPVYSFGIYEEDNSKVKKEDITEDFLETKRIFNAPKCIRDTCDKYLDDSSREAMIFICFYSTIEHLKKLKPKTATWFKNAFSDKNYKIRNIEVHSDNEEEHNKNILTKLVNYNPKPNTITLIHSVDMLNMGYHINNLTGIVMLRNTSSNIVYTQQLGRVFSMGDMQTKLVFDFVQNVFMKTIFELDEESKTNRLVQIDRTKIKDLQKQLDSKQITREEYNKLVTEYLESLSTNNTSNTNNVSSNPNSNSKNTITVGKKLTPNQVIMTVDIAKARDYLKRAVSTDVAIRIRRAINLHFKRYCAIYNITFPISMAELNMCYSLKYSDYIEWLKKKIEGTDYLDITSETPILGEYFRKKYIDPFGKYNPNKNILDIRRFARLESVSEDALIDYLMQGYDI